MSKAKKSILIIEDDEMIGEMYKTKLEADGYEVTLSADGVDGKEKALKGGFDLILLDIILPQLDGFSILSSLRETADGKKAKVVLLTNLGTEEDIAKGKSMDILDYLVKSNLTPTEISEKIKQYL